MRVLLAGARSLRGAARRVVCTPGHSLCIHGQLVDSGAAAADRAPAHAVSRLDHVEQVLARLSARLPRRELRRACRMRDSALSDAPGQLLTAGRVGKSPAGYSIAPPS
jgi:hypothetical protein